MFSVLLLLFSVIGDVQLYPQLHSSCGHWHDSYIRLHEDIASGRLPPHFLVVRSHANFSLASRLFGASSALLYALLTERALLIHVRFLLLLPTNFFCLHWQDEVIAAFLEPAAFDWRFSLHDRSDWPFVEIMNCSSIKGAVDDASFFFSFVVLEEIWQDTAVLNFLSNVPWHDPLFGNFLYDERLVDQMGISSANSWFPCAMDFLFRNSKHLDAVVSEQKRMVTGENRFNIGLELRDVSEVHHFVDCATQIEREEGLTAGESQWLIVTDRPEETLPVVRELAGPERKVFWFESAVDHMKSFVDHQLLAVKSLFSMSRKQVSP